MMKHESQATFPDPLSSIIYVFLIVKSLILHYDNLLIIAISIVAVMRHGVNIKGQFHCLLLHSNSENLTDSLSIFPTPFIMFFVEFAYP